MELNREVEGVEGEIYKRTGVSSTELRQKKRMEVDVLDYAMGESYLWNVRMGNRGW